MKLCFRKAASNPDGIESLCACSETRQLSASIPECVGDVTFATTIGAATVSIDQCLGIGSLVVWSAFYYFFVVVTIRLTVRVKLTP